MKKKIGLCLAFSGQNYGMLLQAFATQQIVEKLGYDTEIIDYTRTSGKHVRFTPWLLVYNIKKNKKKKARKKIAKPVLDAVHKENAEQRKRASDLFRKEYLHDVAEVKGIEALEERALDYDGVLVGSDQQWLPDVAFSNFRTLRFVPDKINKISYATSLGVSEYPLYVRSSARQFLKRIDHISVREEQGKKIINGLGIDNVEVVADPTYLFTKEQWLELIPDRKVVDGPYVLCYFLGKADEEKAAIKRLAEKRGVKVVSIMSDEAVTDSDEKYADVVVKGEGPETFINLIRHAETVYTDSFHGLAFSVINERDFIVTYRVREGAVSRSSRIDNILALWGLQDRLCTEKTPEAFDKGPIDYKAVRERVEEKRTASLKFLENALKDK